MPSVLERRRKREKAKKLRDMLAAKKVIAQFQEEIEAKRLAGVDPFVFNVPDPPKPPNVALWEKIQAKQKGPKDGKA